MFKKQKSKTSAKIIYFQIKTIEKKLKTFRNDLRGQEQNIDFIYNKVYKSSIIFDTNEYLENKYKIIKYLNEADIYLIDNFYDIASRLKRLQLDIINSIKSNDTIIKNCIFLYDSFYYPLSGTVLMEKLYNLFK